MIQRKKWNKLEVDLYGLTCNLTFHLLVVVENALWARLAEHLVPVPVTLGPLFGQKSRSFPIAFSFLDSRIILDIFITNQRSGIVKWVGSGGLTGSKDSPASQTFHDLPPGLPEEPVFHLFRLSFGHPRLH